MKKYLIIAGVALIGALVFWLQRDPTVNPADVPKLGIDDSAKVLIKKNSVVVVSKDKTGKDKASVKFIPDHATITVKKDGTVEFIVKEKGFEFQPGISCIYANRKLMLGLDTQWFYWKRLSLHTGTGLDFGEANAKKNFGSIVSSLLNPYVAIGYRLPYQRLSNTSIVVGYGFSHKETIVGVSLRF